jgi:hypothetical protein
MRSEHDHAEPCFLSSSYQCEVVPRLPSGTVTLRDLLTAPTVSPSNPAKAGLLVLPIPSVPPVPPLVRSRRSRRPECRLGRQEDRCRQAWRRQAQGWRRHSNHGGADSAFSWVVHNRLAFLSAPKTFRMKRSAPCWIISILRDSLSSRRSILRLTYEQGLRSGDRKTSVATYLLGAREAGLSWPLRRIG